MQRLEYILEVTSKALEIPVEKIVGKSRANRYSEARAIISYFARQEEFVYEEIGQMLGGRGHDTIIHSYKCAENWMEKDKSFRKKYKLVKRLLSDSYENYLKNQVRIRAITKIELCALKTMQLLQKLDKELQEIIELKSELNIKQQP